MPHVILKHLFIRDETKPGVKSLLRQPSAEDHLWNRHKELGIEVRSGGFKGTNSERQKIKVHFKI